MDLDQRRCSVTMSNARSKKHRCFLIQMEAEKSWVHMKSTRSSSVINMLTWLVLLRLVYRHALSYSALPYSADTTFFFFFGNSASSKSTGAAGLFPVAATRFVPLCHSFSQNFKLSTSKKHYESWKALMMVSILGH